MALDTHGMVFRTGEPAYAVNRDGVIIAWNMAASRVFGFEAERAVGSRCWQLLQGQDAYGNRYCNAHCPLREMAFSNQAVNRCRLSLRTADEGFRDFTLTTLVLGDAHEATLIHLCRVEPAPAGEPAAATRGLRRDVLTPREHQVLRLLAEGRTTREIAALLSIGVPTVRSHVEHIMQKLHAHSRLEAVAIGRRLGLH